jgi:hypothetical protein
VNAEITVAAVELLEDAAELTEDDRLNTTELADDDLLEEIKLTVEDLLEEIGLIAEDLLDAMEFELTTLASEELWLSPLQTPPPGQ